MCEPVTVAAVSAQIVGGILKSQAQLAQGEATALSYGLSADSAQRAAADAVERGQLKDLQVALRASAVTSAAAVQQSASGSDASVGGAFAARKSTEAIAEVDRKTVARNAALEAYGLREHARGYLQQAANARAAAKNAAAGAFLSGIVGAAASASKMFGDAKPAANATPDTSSLSLWFSGN